MKKNHWLFFFLLLFSKSTLKAASNQEASVLAVTAGCYADFLNSTATTDPHDLYDAKMALEAGAILRAGAPGNYFYFVETHHKNELVHEMSYENQMRFCNWIENERSPSDTEKGAYDVTSLEKSASATCAIIDTDDGKTFCDPSLKINTTTFSITGPAALLGAGSTLIHPQLSVGEEVLLPFSEELEYLFGMLLVGSAMEGARDGSEDRMPGERTATELDARRETSTTTTADSGIKVGAFLNKRPRLTLLEQLQDVEEKYQLAQKQDRTASTELEDARQKWKEIQFKIPEAAKIAEEDYERHFSYLNNLYRQECSVNENLCAIDWHIVNARSNAEAVPQLRQTRLLNEYCLNGLKEKITQATIYLTKLRDARDNALARWTHPNRESQLSEAYEKRERATCVTKTTKETLNVLAARDVDLQKAIVLKNCIDALSERLREEIEPLKNQLPSEKIKLFSLECTRALFKLPAAQATTDRRTAALEQEVMNLFHQKIEELKAELLSRETEIFKKEDSVFDSQREELLQQSNLSSAENTQIDENRKTQNIKDQVTAIFSMIREKLEIVEEKISPQEMRQLLADCEEVIAQLTTDKPAESIKEAIVQIFDKRFSEFQEKRVTDHQTTDIKESLPSNLLEDATSDVASTLSSSSSNGSEQVLESAKKENRKQKRTTAAQKIIPIVIQEERSSLEIKACSTQEFLGEGAVAPDFLESILKPVDSMSHYAMEQREAVSHFVKPMLSRVASAYSATSSSCKKLYGDISWLVNDLREKFKETLELDPNLSCDEGADILAARWNARSEAAAKLKAEQERETLLKKQQEAQELEEKRQEEIRETNLRELLKQEALENSKKTSASKTKRKKETKK